MRVKMVLLAAGPEGVYKVGEVYDFPLPKATALVNSRAAEWVDVPVETADYKPVVESATVAPMRKRGRPPKNAA